MRYNITVLAGDGIGPAITGEAVRVLEKLMKDEIASGRIELRRIDGLTIENREKAFPRRPLTRHWLQTQCFWEL